MLQISTPILLGHSHIQLIMSPYPAAYIQNPGVIKGATISSSSFDLSVYNQALISCDCGVVVPSSFGAYGTEEKLDVIL